MVQPHCTMLRPMGMPRQWRPWWKPPPVTAMCRTPMETPPCISVPPKVPSLCQPPLPTSLSDHFLSQLQPVSGLMYTAATYQQCKWCGLLSDTGDQMLAGAVGMCVGKDITVFCMKSCVKLQASHVYSCLALQVLSSVQPAARPGWQQLSAILSHIQSPNTVLTSLCDRD